MNYFVDISFDLSRENFSATKEKTTLLFFKYNGYRYYENFEIQGRGRIIKRNHCVITFIFDEELSSLDDIIKFLKSMKMLKKSTKVHIECVYNDFDYKPIFASKKYVKMLDKFQQTQYYDHIKETKRKNKQDELTNVTNVTNVTNATNTTNTKLLIACACY